MSAGPTPSQTIGPFFAVGDGAGMLWPDGPHVVGDDAPGACWIRGRVLDGEGEPVPDALVETWQADPEGRLDRTEEGFRAFGRCPTDAEGWFGIRTCKPGPVPGPDGRPQAPHLAVSVFARGLLNRVVTRCYFPDEAEANAADPVLAEMVDAARRATLVAAPAADGYRFDIHLQGPDETVFFAV